MVLNVETLIKTGGSVDVTGERLTDCEMRVFTIEYTY